MVVWPILTLLFGSGADLWRPMGPWEISASLSEGYSHYNAAELNEVLGLMEQLTRETAGLNPYSATGFDGHPATMARLSLRKGPWTASVETEFWTQSFAQSDVPFDLGDNQRTTSITCAEIVGQNLQGLAGCIQAKEDFTFLPVTLQLSWMPQWTPWLRAGAGYGVGVLGGSASLELSTVYYGQGAAAPDKIRFDIVPEPQVNPVQKFFAAVEWTPLKWLGAETRGGWRISRVGGFTLRNPQGSSQVFNAAFQNPSAGDQLWIRWPTSAPDRRSLWIGSRDTALANSSRYGHQLVQGNFDGWFAALSLEFRL
jgi:hypothetical protein